MTKKILLIVSSILVIIGLCSCGKGGGLFSSPTPTPIPVVSPTDVLPAAEVAEFVGYEPQLDGEVTDKDHTKTAVYVSNPVGQSDSVTVKVTQFGEGFTKDDVWNRYDNGRVKRSSAEMVEGIGNDAYIAIPSIHIYDRGCEIIISAGSGSSDEQKNLLKRLGERAVLNFENIITEEPQDASTSVVTQE